LPASSGDIEPHPPRDMRDVEAVPALPCYAYQSVRVSGLTMVKEAKLGCVKDRKKSKID
jgi:hypothetical protein